MAAESRESRYDLVMRAWTVWGAVLAAGVATAAPHDGDVTALVRRNLDGISNHCDEPADCAIDPTTQAFSPLGLSWDRKPDDGVSWSELLFPGFDGDVKLVVKPGLVSADASVAWFQVPFTAITTPAPAPEDVGHTPMRSGGIAVKQKDGWHLAAIGYTFLISDHELFTQHPHPDWFDAKEFAKLDVKGDDKLAREVIAGWFATGFAAHAGPTDRLIASGSSEPELARGAAALKLVKGWDKLGIRPWQIDAERVAGGKLAFVAATVLLPIKGPSRCAPLVLFAVLVQDGAGWRWVSLQYGAVDR